jgi:hypothetical protein
MRPGAQRPALPVDERAVHAAIWCDQVDQIDAYTQHSPTS